MVLTNAQMAFRVRNRVGFTSNLSLLRQDLREMPACPSGGEYSVILGKPEGAFTMHCTVLRHDAGKIHPAGFTHTTDWEIEEAAPHGVDWENRRTCRANMHTLLNAQDSHRTVHGKYTMIFAEMKDIIDTMPICPDGGKYTFDIGTPKDSITIHCSVRAHDAGFREPRGYSPGRNSE